MRGSIVVSPFVTCLERIELDEETPVDSGRGDIEWSSDVIDGLSRWKIVTYDRVRVKVRLDKTLEVLFVDDSGPCYVFLPPVHPFGVFNDPADIPLDEVDLKLRDAADYMA